MADEQVKDAVKAAAGSKGALARKQNLSPERLSEIAAKAAASRWSKGVPRAVNEGILKIGNVEIKCAVLETGKRLINQESFLAAIGRARKAKAGTGAESGVDNLPAFLAAENLKPFISDDLRESTTPIMYTPLNGGRAFGYDALLLPKVCDVYLRLRDEKKDLKSQRHVVQAAYMLMRGLAHVGIIALVDKATGYDERTTQEELLRILEKYIAPELLPWIPRFPADFFREIYRLHKWQYNDATTRRTPLVGKLINKYIYEPLPPGVLEELRRKNPVTDKGYRRHKHFQFLTNETGIPHLDDQIRMVTMLMRISDTREQFRENFEKAFANTYQHRLFVVDVPRNLLESAN